MKRYIIVNRQAGLYDGIYYSYGFADQSIGHIRETWPALSWEVEEVDCGFPVPGLIHLGEVRAKGILKRHSSGELQGNAH